jgi:hypothetical protein
MAIPRRALLYGFLPAASLPLFAKKPFWLEKPADQWSPEEVDELMTKSPWAHSVTAQFSGALQTGMPGGSGRMGRGGGMGRGMPGGGIGGGGEMSGGGAIGGPGGGGLGGPGGGGMPGAMPEIKVLIRWESAEPLRLARGGRWPSQYDQMYVLSVSGLPMGQGRGPGRREGAEANPEGMRQRMMSQLREFTELRRKGREPAGPETIDAREGNGGRLLLFAFPHGAEPIALEEKEVEFRTRMGPLDVRAKFKLKDMLYRGRLAL